MKDLNRYHHAVQELCSVLQPVTAARDVRHTEAKDELSKHILRYTTKDSEEHAERCGVHHLVHAWSVLGVRSVYAW